MYLSAHCAPRSRVRIDIPCRETRARGILIELTRAVFPAASRRATLRPARIRTKQEKTSVPIRKMRNHDDRINLSVSDDTAR